MRRKREEMRGRTIKAIYGQSTGKGRKRKWWLRTPSFWLKWLRPAEMWMKWRWSGKWEWEWEGGHAPKCDWMGDWGTIAADGEMKIFHSFLSSKILLLGRKDGAKVISSLISLQCKFTLRFWWGMCGRSAIFAGHKAKRTQKSGEMKDGGKPI